MTALADAGSSFDGGLYTRIADLARQAPAPLDSVVSAWSTYGLALFGVLLLMAWWRARREDAPRAAQALAAPLVVIAAFTADSAIKSLVREQRPCQTLHTLTLEACPALGDWSLPSNHAAVAAAAAVALLLTDRRLGGVAVPAAVLMAASRVWVGAHYPHDVLLGLLVGAVVALPLMVAARRAAALVDRLRASRLRPLVASR
ncbi:phosphatase PAP2 family protein [Streptomyces sp. H27-D2]|uniref:phosphatase PAP2 family protein n=1 Tax=Streptomyces sp. H27-D2 TaxID=3046304 RepID=UPI002DBBE4D2|nr:phosphatase PAP2 family protein [Streptomyces sp. H27-D2]MEC4015396.1 phosphatase PAP2 family protein [Streptomyces sp. H27-D2]